MAYNTEIYETIEYNTTTGVIMKSGVSYVNRLPLLKVGETAKAESGKEKVDTLSKGEYVARPDAFLKVLEEYKHDAIQDFCEEVNELAMRMMEQTGKLEGMHRLAIIKVCKSRGIPLYSGFGEG